MKVVVQKTAIEMGKCAAELIAQKLRSAIIENGEARIILSTGSSQFETFDALVKEDVDWSRVTAFHLDEYIALPITHSASFRKYLKERFADLVPLKEMVYVNTEGDITESIKEVTARLRERPIDIGVIGIGENAHIAFNDPPADFNTKEAYIIVNLDERCKKQQVGEGWFETVDDVPKQAISMTPFQIMLSRCIVSAVPHKVKAEAVAKVLSAETTTPMIPATLLKEHPDFNLFLDADSASLCEQYRMKE